MWWNWLREQLDYRLVGYYNYGFNDVLVIFILPRINFHAQKSPKFRIELRHLASYDGLFTFKIRIDMKHCKSNLLLQVYEFWALIILPIWSLTRIHRLVYYIYNMCVLGIYLLIITLYGWTTGTCMWYIYIKLAEVHLIIPQFSKSKDTYLFFFFKLKK